MIQRIAKPVALLAAALVCSVLIAGACLESKLGVVALASSALAGAVVLVADVAALVIVGRAQPGPGAVSAVLAGMLVRMVLPLAGVAYFSYPGHNAPLPGFVGFLLTHYFIGLIVGTWLSLRLAGSSDRSQGADAVAPSRLPA